MTNFQINITSDTVCPWCYVGKKRLEKGIAAYKAKYPERNDTFDTTWKPFYLNPDAGKSMDKQQVYETKFGPQRTAMMQKMLSQVGHDVGINFKYGGRTGNTRDSHRLVQLGRSKSPALQTRIIEQLFQAYFEEEKDITSHAVLLEAGTKAGVDEAEVKKLLDSDQMGDVVDEEVGQAQRRFISGVPHFVIQNKYEVGGAQEPETFVEIFEDLAKEQGVKQVGQGTTC